VPPALGCLLLESLASSRFSLDCDVLRAFFLFPDWRAVSVSLLPLLRLRRNRPAATAVVDGGLFEDVFVD